MARRSASRRGKRRPRAREGGGLRSAMAYVFIGLLMVVIVGGMLFAHFQKSSEIDARTLCPKTGPEAGLVILLDLTDKIGATQHKLLRTKLDKEIEDARPNTLITVGAVQEAPAARGADFALCKPRKKGNELYENLRLLEERYKKKFQKPFSDALKKMLTAKAAERSPIMESLQALLADAPGFLDAKYERSVIIVSDLLQHSAVFSFYRGDTWRKFRRSRDFARLARNLRGVDVKIWRVPRPKARINAAAVENFWANYFDRAGARNIHPEPFRDL